MYLPDVDKILINNALSSIPVFDNNIATVGWSSLDGTALSSQISALDISTSPANILVYGSDNGRVYKANNVNASPSVSEITGSNFPRDAWGSCITIDPKNANNIFVIFSNYNVKSFL